MSKSNPVYVGDEEDKAFKPGVVVASIVVISFLIVFCCIGIYVVSYFLNNIYPNMP